MAGVSVHGTWNDTEKTSPRRSWCINRLDRVSKQHDIDYSRANNIQDKWKADTKMIKAIDKLPGRKSMTERVVKRIMQAKKKLKL